MSTSVKKRKGFTIIELMVSMAIMAILLTALVFIYRAGMTEAEHTSGRMALQSQARLLMDKMVPLVSTAVKLAGDEASDPLFFPTGTMIGNGQPKIEWRSSADLFNAQNVVGTADFRILRQYAYRIEYDTNDAYVRLQELDLATLQPTATEPRVLAQGIDGLTFTRIDASAVAVQIRVSNRVLGRSNGELMRRWDTSQDADGNAGGDRRTYTLESALILPVFTGI